VSAYLLEEGGIMVGAIIGNIVKSVYEFGNIKTKECNYRPAYFLQMVQTTVV